MSYRIERINHEMLKAISGIIVNKIKDPRVTEMVSVTKVDTSKDLKNAKVYLSVYGNKEKIGTTFDAVAHCAGFIRKELSFDFKDLRTLPELTFLLDDSMEYGQNIEALLDDIKKHDNH